MHRRFFVVYTLMSELRGNRRTTSTCGRVSAPPLSEVPARGRPHLVELDLLVGVEQPLDLRMRAVADDTCQDRDGIQLRLQRLVEGHDLAVLQINERIHGGLLLWGELELFRHALPVSAGSAVATVTAAHCTVGGESKRPASDKCAEQEHQRVALASVHHSHPQCDMT